MPSTRAEILTERARETFWLVPGASVLVALVLGWGLPALERSLGGPDAAVFFGGGPDGARSVLSTVASSTITVTSLTFSLTVVTLQLASSQFSPRILRTFLRDLRNQAVLGLLLASFAFSLMVLLSVRSVTEGDAFVPAVAVTTALVLAVTSVLALVWFIAHVVEVTRVEQTMNDITEGTARLLATEPEDAVPSDPITDTPEAGRPVRSRRSGFVESVDGERLLRWSIEHEARVDVVVPVGAWVLQGQPLMRIHHEGPDGAEPSGGVVVGVERTGTQDLTFGLSQLVDIALRALSPGVNDPTTASTAVGHVAALLVAAADRPLGDYALREAGVPRVQVRRPSFGDLVDASFGAIRRSAAREPSVLTALVQSAGVIGEQFADRQVREPLLRLVGEVDATAAAAPLAASESAALEGCVRRARAQLTYAS